MKKFLLSAIAFVCTALSYAASGTDTFGYSSEGMPLADYYNGTVVGSETGAKYSLKNIWGWFCCYMKPGDNALVTVEESPGIIKSIYRASGLGDTFIAVYGSTSPITADNIGEATLIGQLGAESVMQIEGEYTYVALQNDSEGEVYFDALSFTWEDAGGGQQKSDEDHISAPNIMSQNPDGIFDATKYDDHSKSNATMQYTGESGAVYNFTSLISNGTWWTLDWDYPNPQGYMANATDAGYIASIKFDMDWAPEYLQLLVSAEPITPENKWDATSVYLYRENGEIPEWKANGLYKYFYLNSAQEKVLDITVKWSDEAPVIEAAQPTINCWDDRVVPGSNVSISTATADATLHVNVYVNGEIHYGEGENTTTTVYEGSSYSFSMPGKSGDAVKVEAFATKDGYLDSQTAVQEYTLEQPLAERPTADGYYDTVVPGQTIVLSTTTENATISYNYGVMDWDNPDNEWESGPIKAPSPVSVTVPENAQPGQTFFIEATASAEGYETSYMFELYSKVISAQLDAPTLSISPNSEVLAGTVLTITRPSNATTIHYTINGGEEVAYEGYSTDIAIDSDMTIEAWATGDAPFTASDKVTATYTIEKLTEYQDAIVPGIFTQNLENYMYFEYTATATHTNYTYIYNGGMYPRDGKPCFYLDANDEDGSQSILYNTAGRQITRVKLESPVNWSGCYVMFAKEPITEVTEEMKNFEDIPGRLRIKTNDEVAQYGFGEWIDLTTLGEDFKDCSYFAVWRFGQNSYLSRIVVEYANNVVGIEEVSQNDGDDCRIYDLNGLAMPKDATLNPGIYVRVTGSKTEKILVK